MSKSPLNKYLPLAISLVFAACSEPEVKQDKVEIRTPAPIVIAVGDTSPVLVLSKTLTDATGRTYTTNPYSSFGLIIGDTTIAGVVNIQRIVGRIPGETTVKAKDEKSSMVSDAIKVQVISKL